MKTPPPKIFFLRYRDDAEARALRLLIMPEDPPRLREVDGSAGLPRRRQEQRAEHRVRAAVAWA
jgi:hypothetical protein